MIKSTWLEDPLPTECPPNDAFEPDDHFFYGLVKTFPPRLEDFFSLRKLYPEKEPYSDQSECVQRSCSLFSSYKSCDIVRKTVKCHNNEKIIKIKLPKSCGLIKKTCKNPNHYSWWMKSDFDPIPFCQEEHEV